MTHFWPTTACVPRAQGMSCEENKPVVSDSIARSKWICNSQSFGMFLICEPSSINVKR